jgi:hypothetical protein
MTIDSISNQQNTSDLNTPITVQNELQKDVLKTTTGEDTNSTQNQALQTLASQQPLQSVQQTAQNQLRQYGGINVLV